MSHISSKGKPEAARYRKHASRALGRASALRFVPGFCSAHGVLKQRPARNRYGGRSQASFGALGTSCGAAPRPRTARSLSCTRRRTPPARLVRGSVSHKGQARALRGGYAAHALRSTALSLRAGPPYSGPLRGLPSFRRRRGALTPSLRSVVRGERVPRPPAG